MRLFIARFRKFLSFFTNSLSKVKKIFCNCYAPHFKKRLPRKEEPFGVFKEETAPIGGGCGGSRAHKTP